MFDGTFSAWHEGHHTVSSLKVHYHCLCALDFVWFCVFEYDICCQDSVVVDDCKYSLKYCFAVLSDM